MQMIDHLPHASVINNHLSPPTDYTVSQTMRCCPGEKHNPLPPTKSKHSLILKFSILEQPRMIRFHNPLFQSIPCNLRPSSLHWNIKSSNL